MYLNKPGTKVWSKLKCLKTKAILLKRVSL